MSDLDYSVTDHVATITLNLPKVLNAFTLPMVDAWADRAEAQADPDVHVLVVTGSGRGSCTGVGLASRSSRPSTGTRWAPAWTWPSCATSASPPARRRWRTSLDLVSSHLAVNRTTADSLEAFRVFTERRTPEFTGR